MLADIGLHHIEEIAMISDGFSSKDVMRREVGEDRLLTVMTGVFDLRMEAIRGGLVRSSGRPAVMMMDLDGGRLVEILSFVGHREVGAVPLWVREVSMVLSAPQRVADVSLVHLSIEGRHRMVQIQTLSKLGYNVDEAISVPHEQVVQLVVGSLYGHHQEGVLAEVEVAQHVPLSTLYV